MTETKVAQKPMSCTSHSILQPIKRMKEIGVRKVLGATVAQIIALVILSIRAGKAALDNPVTTLRLPPPILHEGQRGG